MRARHAQATVIGDSDAAPETSVVAEKVGEMLAKHEITLITGGGAGVMEAASRGAKKAGGLVIGIIPGNDVRNANEWCSVVIPTGIGHARNVLTVLAGDFVIALGGGAGTLSEICFAWIHKKPILALPGYGGWAAKLANTSLDHRRSDPILACESVERLEKEVLSLCRGMDLPSSGTQC
jgi:uncharacterized protein (TIGR00725 family)